MDPDDRERTRSTRSTATTPPIARFSGQWSRLPSRIVDDSALVRRITSQLVRSMRHTAVEAVDGEDAVDTVRRSFRDGVLFDVILMDN